MTPAPNLEAPDGLLYTRDHEWLRRDEARPGEAVVGVTAFAQDQLGDVVYLDLPAPGETVTAGERFGEIESVKTVSDLYAPVGGEVIAVNEALTERPELVNTSPYGEGWLLRVRVADASEFGALLGAEAYRALLPAG